MVRLPCGDVSSLGPDDVQEKTAGLAGWAVEDGGLAIVKVFKFPDFVRAFAFMTAAALKAEEMNHHPEWSNVYSRVEVRLTSHDAGGVTERDFELARFMDDVAGA